MDAYEAHGRIVPGPVADQLERIARDWLGHHTEGRTVAIVASTNAHVDALNDAVQRVRFTVGDLDPDAAVPIAGGEWAHPGDLVATRRNDRGLCTERGEPVRNRDLWTVVATHADCALTVSHLGGHGTVTLPAEYTRDHVRLGYAATEHGHQGDTVDVAIALVSSATTHRGLYVGVTRGRDENRIHVITNPTDIGEARDVLDAVLAYDRADIPAVTQRRHLAHEVSHPEPIREQEQLVPEWIANYRVQLEQRGDDLTAGLTVRAQRRAEAAGELADLQPALDAARAAWKPYADRINEIEHELATVLRPAMWQANHAARQAGFGHRHGAARRAKIATWRVDDAQARIAAIHADGAHVKEPLDAVEAEARRLAELASPHTGHFGIDQLDRDQLHALDQTAEAIDAWTTWASGRPVPLAELADAVSLLHDVALHAPALPTRAGGIDRTRWLELLDPVTTLLEQRGPPTRDHLGHDLEHAGPDLSIDL